MLRPTMCSAVCPYTASAPSFQAVMIPSTVLAITASGDDRTMEASADSVARFGTPLRDALTSTP